jgi:hypothetical protein
MTNRVYPYYPSWDGKQTQPVTAKLVELCKARWGTKSLGTYANRPMRNNAGLSVHATGYAADIQYKDELQARQMWDWFLGSSVIDGKTVQHSKHLGLCELHWYAYGEYGAGYRCSRGEGKKGVKVYTATDNAGSYQGNPNWLHFEVSNMSAEAFETAWRSLPKP